MARIPYVDPQSASPSVREALETLPPLNIFRMLANAESTFVPYLGLGGTLLTNLELDPQLRELAILLVAARAGADYEWIQHVGISQTLGVTDEQVSAVKHDTLDAACFDADAQAVLHFTDQVIDRPRPDDDTFTTLSRRLPPRQIVELLLVIGTYYMLARIMTTLDIELDSAIGSTVVDEAHRLLDT
jgi:alkylhydroperoxidase family enzyme